MRSVAILDGAGEVHSLAEAARQMAYEERYVQQQLALQRLVEAGRKLGKGKGRSARFSQGSYS